MWREWKGKEIIGNSTCREGKKGSNRKDVKGCGGNGRGMDGNSREGKKGSKRKDVKGCGGNGRERK